MIYQLEAMKYHRVYIFSRLLITLSSYLILLFYQALLYSGSNSKSYVRLERVNVQRRFQLSQIHFYLYYK